MISRVLAKKLLTEFVERQKARAARGEDFADEAIAETLAESILVLRSPENVQQKAQRLVIEGRLRIERFEPSGLIVASCRGTGATYSLGYDPARREWRCTCAVERGGKRNRRCSHLAALQLVVDEPKTA